MGIIVEVRINESLREENDKKQGVTSFYLGLLKAEANDRIQDDMVEVEELMKSI